MLKRVVLILFLLILSTIAIAECPPDCDYENLDWSTIDPNDIQKIPPDKLNYAALSTDQRKSLTTEQIVKNLENIDDLIAEVDAKKAEEAIKQKYGIIVQLGEGAQIRNNILQTTYGVKDHVTLKDNYYKKGILKMDENGNIIFIPNEGTSITPSLTDSLVLDSTQKQTTLAIADQNIPLEGIVYLKEGNYYAKSLFPISAMQLDINSQEDCLLLFDPTTNLEKYKDQNFVLLSKTRVYANSQEANSITITAQPGNEIFHLFVRDYISEGDLQDEYGTYSLIPDNSDGLRITVSNGDAIEAINRRDKIPLLNHISSTGQTLVENGRLIFRLEDNQVYLDSIKEFPEMAYRVKTLEETRLFYERPQSVALELVSSENKLRINSANQFVFNQGEISGLTFTDRTVTQPETISELLSDHEFQTIAQLQAKYPNILFEEQKEFYFTKFRKQWQEIYGIQEAETTPPSLPFVIQSIDKFLQEYPESHELIDKFVLIHALSGVASVNAKTITVSDRILDPYLPAEYTPRVESSTSTILYHEFVHVQDSHIESQEAAKIAQLISDPELLEMSKQLAVLQKQDAYSSEAEELSEAMDARIKKIREENNIQTLQSIYDEIIETAFEDLKKDQRILDIHASVSERELKKPVHLFELVFDLRDEQKENSEFIENIIEEEYGLPAAYALVSPDWEGQDDSYAELSTTYAEQSIEEKRRKVNQGTPAQQRIFSKLTQLAYDSGKIDKEEYYYIMGDYCNNNPCGKCILYKILCE